MSLRKGTCTAHPFPILTRSWRSSVGNLWTLSVKSSKDSPGFCLIPAMEDFVGPSSSLYRALSLACLISSRYGYCCLMHPSRVSLPYPHQHSISDQYHGLGLPVGLCPYPAFLFKEGTPFDELRAGEDCLRHMDGRQCPAVGSGPKQSLGHPQLLLYGAL